MCGLVGIRRFSGSPVAETEIERMRERIRHRGPDDQGAYLCEGLGLGHVRLSILDLSGRASQPMVSRDGRYVIVFNGEIYNFASLREELHAMGVEVDSTGDTEVLFKLLITHGVDRTVQKLEGFFAFAFWDEERAELTLARDRHGIKPLYYRTDDQELRFSSEARALLGSDPRPDPSVLNAVLLGSGATWGPYTLYEGVRAVEPGQVLTFRGSATAETHRFFQLSDFSDEGLREELRGLSDGVLIDRVHRALENSLDLRMISDAPLACLASGGLDSNLIAAMAARRNRDLVLYHADVQGDSEHEYAAKLASHLGLELKTASMGDGDFIEQLAAVSYYNEIPVIYHENSVPFFLVSKLASGDGIKVVLTGEGSDEYFLGYPHIVLQRYMDGYRRVLRGIANLAHRILPRVAGLLIPRQADSIPELVAGLGFISHSLTQADSHAAFGELESDREKWLHATSLYLAQPHLTTLLHRNDRLAMAWGIESRFPFLGHELARLAVNLPGRMKIRTTAKFNDVHHPFIIDKYCIRKVAERYLPAELSRRPKKGFPVRVSQRIDVAPELFYDGFLADWYHWDRRAVDLVAEQSPRSLVSRLLFVETWARTCLRGEPIDSVRDTLKRFVTIH
jgi:asparagine synthase (glutamine-hydrolysing)